MTISPLSSTTAGAVQLLRSQKPAQAPLDADGDHDGDKVSGAKTAAPQGMGGIVDKLV